MGKKKNGAPGRSRTSDHLIRSQVLYPAELRARIRTRNEEDRRNGTGNQAQVILI